MIQKSRMKVALTIMLITFIPLAMLATIFAYQSYKSARYTMESQAKEKLASILEIKKQQVEQYFKILNDQLVNFADNSMTLDAMKEFKKAFRSYRKELSIQDVNKFKSELRQYYKIDYNNEYSRHNNGIRIEIKKMMDLLDEDSIALQYAFIKNNKFPLGEKDALDKLDNKSKYSSIHEKYHPYIRSFSKRFGFYDIFLVDPDSGDIIYSVFKELDYTTSLINGSYSESKISDAFSNSLHASKGSVYLTDFASYAPSYEDPAAFIATPIYDQKEKVGILIFQMPIDKINFIMTLEQKWRKSGLGKSGETYLVSSDFTMRSISRFLIEDPQGYEKRLVNAGVNRDIINKILVKKTSIGLQPVKTPGVKFALAGQTGYEIFKDYRGVSVLSAFSPVSIPGLKWAILSEIDETEAFYKIYDYRVHIIKVSLFFVVFFGLAIFVISWFVAKQLSASSEYTVPR